MNRMNLEGRIRGAVNDYAAAHGEDHFEITVIVDINIEEGMLNIDTDIEFEDH